MINKNSKPLQECTAQVNKMKFLMASCSSDSEAYLKYQLLSTVCVRADLPSQNLLLGCPCRNYVEVEYPVEPIFCREMDVAVTLLEKSRL